MIWQVTPARASGAQSNPMSATLIKTRIVCLTSVPFIGPGSDSLAMSKNRTNRRISADIAGFRGLSR
jgi:hypothetical protein